MAPQTEMQETAERRTGIAVENKGKTKKGRDKTQIGALPRRITL